MGLLDRLRILPPARVDETPAGRSGRAHFGGLLELDELNIELAGIRGLWKYDEMYFSDPDIRRLVLMCWSPVQAGTWDIEPYGGDEATAQDLEAAEFVKWALWEAMSPNFIRHLETVGPVLLRSGFCPFEQIWMTAEWKGRKVLVPRKLDYRLPRTIYNWFQDDYGELSAIRQLLPATSPVDIPASDLVYYRIGAEGDNWMGRSLLRAAFKPWFIKDKLERIDAIGQERKAVGLPVAYPPTQASPQQREDMETLLANVHINEAGYIVAPGPSQQFAKDAQDAWFIDVVRFDSSSGTGIQESLRYHSEKISSSIVGDFMQLGHHQVGARATADVQEDPFLTVIRALAIGVIADTVNTQLVGKLAALNFPNLEGLPKLTLSLHDEASLSELITFVTGLVAAGGQMDPALEDYLRERADMPPADQKIRKQREQAADAAREQLANAAANPNPADTPPGADDQPPAAKKPPPATAGEKPAKPAADEKPAAKKLDAADEPGRRALAKQQLDPAALKWHEKLLSITHLTDALDGARDTFATAGMPHVVTIAQTMAQSAAAGRSLPKTNTGPLSAALAGELDRLDQLGYSTVTRELHAQHARLGTQPTGQPLQPTMALDDAGTAAGEAGDSARRRRIKKRADLAAQNVVDETRKAVERASVAGSTDAARLQQAGERAGRDALRIEGRVNASGAINGGRAAAAKANTGDIAGGIYTSVLDERTCDYCQLADDGVVRAIDDPVLQSIMPPNPDCSGRDMCRCMIVYVLADDPAALEIES